MCCLVGEKRVRSYVQHINTIVRRFLVYYKSQSKVVVENAWWRIRLTIENKSTVFASKTTTWKSWYDT